MHIQPERRFKTKIDTLSINHELVDTEVVFGEDYHISVLNTLGAGVFGTEDTIPLDNITQQIENITVDTEDGLTYGFRAMTHLLSIRMTSFREDFISLQLFRGSESIAQWRPFETLIPETLPLDSVPFLLRSQVTGSDGIKPLVYQRGTFNAIILGEYMATANVPVSAEPVLEFVLRDPPGDASHSSIDQGSSMSFSKNISFSNADTKSRQQNFQLIPTIGLSNGFSVGLGATKDFEIDVNVEGNVGIVHSEQYSSTSGSGFDLTETFTFNQSVTTSSIEQNMDYGINQDVFFGTVTNTSMGVMNAFKLTPAAPERSSWRHHPQSMAQRDLGLGTSRPSSDMYFQDANDDGRRGFHSVGPSYILGSDGTFIITNGQLQHPELLVWVGWSGWSPVSCLPAIS